MLDEAESCRGVAVMLKGLLRVAKTSEGGRANTLYDIGPGETCILSISCLLTGSVYPARAVVVKDTLAAMIPGDAFIWLFETLPAVRVFVLNHFAERLATTMAVVVEVAFRRVDQRMARWLADTGAADQSIALSHDEVAGQLGTARVVVSRVLEDFEGRG